MISDNGLMVEVCSVRISLLMNRCMNMTIYSGEIQILIRMACLVSPAATC